MTRWRLWLLVLTMAGGQAVPAGAEPTALQVDVSTVVLRQGQTSRVTVTAGGPVTRVTVRFAGRAWPAFPVGPATWRVIVATDPMTAPGSHALEVSVRTGAGTPLAFKRNMTVVRVAFPRRHVRFDPATAALLTPQNVERERRRVREALRVVHPAQLWQDPMAMPADGPVGSPYGVISIYHGKVSGFHGGVDITVPAGTPVRSAADGLVRLAEALPLSGNAVLIDHGLGVVTAYLHLSEISVQVGQRVGAGEVIGRVGSTGLATGPHLHWGLRINGVRVDPLLWVGR